MRVDAPPWVALGALVLAVIPLLSAGAEKEIVAVTSTGMVDRTVPSTVTYVQLTGLAVPAALAAPGAESWPPYGVLVRDNAASDATTIVMTDTPPTSGLTRSVVGRVVRRAGGEDPAAEFAARGDDVTGLDGRMVVAELAAPPPDESVIPVTGASDVQAAAEGSVVQLDLTFAGESLPACTLSEAGCGPRTLAGGAGVFLHLAYATRDGGAILVQTGYPSSVVPGTWTGTQVRNGEDLVPFANSVPVRILAGWGRVLVLVSIADDPALVRDRLWIGPVLLGLLAGLLWLGGRIGYPYFRPGLERRRRWATAEDGAARPLPADGLAVRVSGHTRTLDGQRRYLDDAPTHLVRSAGAVGAAGRAPLVLALADGSEIPLAAHDLGALGSVEPGEVVTLSGRRPALWAHWFGTDLRLTFETTEERDLAARAVAATGPPVRSSP